MDDGEPRPTTEAELQPRQPGPEWKLIKIQDYQTATLYTWCKKTRVHVELPSQEDLGVALQEVRREARAELVRLRELATRLSPGTFVRVKIPNPQWPGPGAIGVVLERPKDPRTGFKVHLHNIGQSDRDIDDLEPIDPAKTTTESLLTFKTLSDVYRAYARRHG